MGRLQRGTEGAGMGSRTEGRGVPSKAVSCSFPCVRFSACKILLISLEAPCLCEAAAAISLGSNGTLFL